eukprot:CAMPEP_0119299176 /NCGR_PEP_ID=MMETSP1333-20130426/1290_1 /TAXON_ID=418940 /ORGANISM="Scyphosphaera apsteinii, Strain RCC1455" /LENGTH=173 /DNA_ID=CAMNT_0007300519 /DNA_START=201 /DNA_END=722 /DNA_ORIENTATION=-
MEGVLQKRFVEGKTGPLGGTVIPNLKAKAAGLIVTPSKAAPNMAAKMAESMPQKMREKGISAAARVRLVQGPVFVIEVTVKEVSLDMITSKLEAAKPNTKPLIDCLLGCISSDMKVRIQEELLASKIAAKMAETMGAQIEAQTAEQGVVAKARGLSKSEEGPYLLDVLEAYAK